MPNLQNTIDKISGNTPGGMSTVPLGGATGVPPNFDPTSLDFGTPTRPTAVASPYTAPAASSGGVDYNSRIQDILSQASGIQTGIDNLRATEGEPTIGSAFAAPDPLGYGDANVESYLQGLAYNPVDEKDIQRRQLKMFQAEIDAVNEAYDQMVRQSRMEGEGRLGSQRAIAARGGLLGSDFAGAQKDRVQDYNSQIIGGVEAERSARIGSILGLARKSAADEIAAKNQARAQGAEAYLSYLGNKQARKQQNLAGLANTMLTQGVSPEDIQDQLAGIASQYGVSEDDIIAAYSDAAALQTTEQGDQFTLSSGEQRYDAQGNLIAEGPQSAGGTVYSTSSGLVRVDPTTGEAQLIFGTGGGGSGSNSVSFTNTENKKLEQAGLQNAPRQQQLDFLYGSDSTDEFTLDTARQWVTANMGMGREALKNELINGGLSVTLANGVLDEVGLGSDTNVLSDDLFSSNRTKIAEALRKAASKWTASSEEELQTARSQVEKGTLTISGKKYQLTPQQKQELLAELDTIGPRSLLERVLPGGG